MTDDNLPDVAYVIKQLWNRHTDFGGPQSLYADAASLLESLSARVTQAETEVADRCAHIVRTTETTSGAMGWYEQKALADAANRIDAAFAQPAPGTGNEASNG